MESPINGHRRHTRKKTPRLSPHADACPPMLVECHEALLDFYYPRLGMVHIAPIKMAIKMVIKMVIWGMVEGKIDRKNHGF